MKKGRRPARHFDDQFRLSVLKDYYESGASYSQISRKYDVSSGNVIAWEEDKLREENARLRKALEYSELRNEALNEVLKIGREQYGIDLLKKAGAKQ